LNKYLHYDTSVAEVNINISANNGNEKLRNKKKNTAISGKLIIALYASYIYVCISCTCLSGRLFVGLGGWGARGNERNIWL